MAIEFFCIIGEAPICMVNFMEVFGDYIETDPILYFQNKSIINFHKFTKIKKKNLQSP
jgi:hypothetical protein